MRSSMTLFFGAAAMAAVCGCQSPQGDTVQAQRADVARTTRETLEEFRRVKPGLEAELEKAPSYAVFNNIGLKFAVAGSGNGYGIVHDNRTGNDTYMRMAQLNLGLGFGIQKVRVLFVFNDADAMRKFIEEGMEFGAGAKAVAKAEGEGAGIAADASVNPISIYQLTDTGLALTATVAGTKYWKDAELNSASGETVPKNVRIRQKIQSAVE